MSKFDFHAAVEPEHEYLFRRIGSEETTTVAADTVDDAWKAIEDEREDWKAWMLIHRKDIAESLSRERPLEVSSDYGRRQNY
jgi:hypothetical protein